MKKKMIYGFIMSVSIMVFIHSVFAAEHIPSPGESFPEITLSMPDTAEHRDYLGLKGNGPFKLSQIKADILIIEIFSMYCPYCQKEAPNVNELYRVISGRTDIKDKIRIIGIGAGNTPFEVDVFRKQFAVSFPLFSDESFSVHKASGGVRTPHFFVIKRNPDRSSVIVYSKVGSILDPQQFLDIIIKQSGL
jgi:peroxiredoxin